MKIAKYIENFEKDMVRFLLQATKLQVKADKILEQEVESGTIVKRAKGYQLNPSRKNTASPENLKKDRELRKEAREVERQLAMAQEGLILQKDLFSQGVKETERRVNLTLENLKQLDKTLQELPKRLESFSDRARLLRYRRSKELQFVEKVCGQLASPKTSSKSIRTEAIGDMTMSTQKQIKELLGELEKATDSMEKRKLRMKLRRLGHTGGLGQATKKATKKASKKATKKASKKATKKASKKATKKASKKKIENTASE